MLGNTLVTPPSVEANTARKPYLQDGGKAVFCSDTLEDMSDAAAHSE